MKKQLGILLFALMLAIGLTGAVAAASPTFGQADQSSNGGHSNSGQIGTSTVGQIGHDNNKGSWDDQKGQDNNKGHDNKKQHDNKKGHDNKKQHDNKKHDKKHHNNKY